jgi:hypothetical protein
MGKGFTVACSKDAHPVTKPIVPAEVIDGSDIRTNYSKNNKTIYLA